MTHPRRLIRQRVVELLTAQRGDPPVYPTSAERRVYDSRDLPIDETSGTPAILVYTLREELDEAEQMDGGIRRRTMDLLVEIYRASVTPDGYEGPEVLGGPEVDDIAWRVESIVYANPTLGDMVERCTLISTDIQVSEDGVVPLWAAIMLFRVVYVTHLQEVEGSPPTQILLGFEPDTGPGNEPFYTEVFRLPDLPPT